MGTKSIDWRPGPTVCRCCLAEGCYKDISTEYFWMGKREVYSEMLTETFDINIAYSTSGPNSNSRLICEPCISRLRDACEFKRQVHECEKTFMQYLDPGASSTMLDTQVTVEVMDSEVKLEQVKQEKAHSDDDDDDDFAGPNYPDDDEDDDDLDDQPLTKFATRIPKKESVDILDLLDNAKAAEKRKSTTKSKAPPPKKTKVNLKDIQIKPTASKAKSSSTQGKVLKITPAKPPIQVKPVAKVVKKKKANPAQSDDRRNAEVILANTTAYPFRLPEERMMCVYCCEEFGESAEFRKHMEDEHRVFKLYMAFTHLPDGIGMKVDITDLRCRLCQIPHETLEGIAAHLNECHDCDLNLNSNISLQPFKLGKRMSCAVCSLPFPCLRSLSRHTQTHFLKYTCESCGKSYSTITSLQGHVRYSHIKGKYLCRKCKTTFSTLNERREHLKISTQCCQHCCFTCNKRFATWNLKLKHMEEVHGKRRRIYPCIECDMVFKTRDTCRVHFKIVHTEDHVTCTVCSRKFDTEQKLSKHMVVHTGDKKFACDVCNKSFPRKANLRQHSWIHSEVKRFACGPCNKQFAQRISWRTHMKSYHPEWSKEY